MIPKTDPEVKVALMEAEKTLQRSRQGVPVRDYILAERLIDAYAQRFDTEYHSKFGVIDEDGKSRAERSLPLAELEKDRGSKKPEKSKKAKEAKEVEAPKKLDGVEMVSKSVLVPSPTKDVDYGYDYRNTFTRSAKAQPEPPLTVFRGNMTTSGFLLDEYPTYQRIALGRAKSAGHKEKRHFPRLQYIDQTQEVFTRRAQ